MARRTSRDQRGGALGTVVLLVVIAFVGYWVYNHVLFNEEPASCKATLNACIKSCRRSTSEAAENQACERRCEQQAEACQGK